MFSRYPGENFGSELSHWIHRFISLHCSLDLRPSPASRLCLLGQYGWHGVFSATEIRSNIAFWGWFSGTYTTLTFFRRGCSCMMTWITLFFFKGFSFSEWFRVKQKQVCLLSYIWIWRFVEPLDMNWLKIRSLKPEVMRKTEPQARANNRSLEIYLKTNISELFKRHNL